MKVSVWGILLSLKSVWWSTLTITHTRTTCNVYKWTIERTKEILFENVFASCKKFFFSWCCESGSVRAKSTRNLIKREIKRDGATEYQARTIKLKLIVYANIHTGNAKMKFSLSKKFCLKRKNEKIHPKTCCEFASLPLALLLLYTYLILSEEEKKASKHASHVCSVLLELNFFDWLDVPEQNHWNNSSFRLTLLSKSFDWVCNYFQLWIFRRRRTFYNLIPKKKKKI